MCAQGKHGIGDSKGVFMVYSDGPIDERLPSLFVSPQLHHTQHWRYTFGELVPITNPALQTQPVVLAEGLYNANAMESIRHGDLGDWGTERCGARGQVGCSLTRQVIQDRTDRP